MGVESKNVFIGSPDQAITGAILSGTETDTIPETIDDLPTSGYSDSGYVDEEGVTITPEESTESIRDWSLKTIRQVLTEFNGTIAWQHLELSVDALKNYMGDDNVEVTAADSTHGTRVRAAIAGEQRPIKSWIFKMKDGPRRAAVFVPHGQITERGEIPLVASGAIKLPVTMTTYPDSDGKNIYILTDDGVVSASAPPSAWQATTAHDVGDQVTLTGGEVLQATVAGTTDATEPAAPAIGSTVVDGTVTWERIS